MGCNPTGVDVSHSRRVFADAIRGDWESSTGRYPYEDWLAYILIGYFFGKKWKLLEAWLGPTALYLILAGIALVVLGVVFRHSVSEFLKRLVSKKTKRT
jgi:hypothetical protein